MIEHEENFERQGPDDAERRRSLFDVGRALVDVPGPRGNVYFDEAQLAYIAMKPAFGEVWRDFHEVYHRLANVYSMRHIEEVLRDAREREGVRVELHSQEGVAPGRVIAVVGYDLSFPDAIAGIAVAESGGSMIPVTIWPRDERVDVLQPGQD